MIDEFATFCIHAFQTQYGTRGRARRMFAITLVGTWRSAVLVCPIGIALAASESKARTFGSACVKLKQEEEQSEASASFWDRSRGSTNSSGANQDTD
jgi:hypothetical protein